jgi:hypothetical protein
MPAKTRGRIEIRQVRRARLVRARPPAAPGHTSGISIFAVLSGLEMRPENVVSPALTWMVIKFRVITRRPVLPFSTL